MSIQDAEKFLDKLKTDKTFGEQVMEKSQEVIDLAKANNLEFTREELRTDRKSVV